MKKKLSEPMLSVVERILLNRVPDKAYLVNELLAGNADRTICNEVIEFVAEELCEKGFDENSEPTTYGRHLEDIIDVLNRRNLQ